MSIKKKNQNNLSICIVGPGIVGQATGKVFAKHGFPTAFLGGNITKRQQLHAEGYTVYDTDELMDSGYDFDITMLTVPTPTIDGKIDLSAITSAATDLGKRLKQQKKYHLVVVKSTVPPGTTESLVIPLIEKYSGKKVGKDFGACMNPEYLREISAYDDTLKAWIITIGAYDQKSGDTLKKAYAKFTCPIETVSIPEAEMQKYVHNLYNAVKITFFNEMRAIARSIDADADRIFALTAISSEGMWNTAYGTKDRGAFDGSCLPKDTKAFLRWATGRSLPAKLLATTIQVNEDLMQIPKKVGGKKATKIVLGDRL